MGIRVLEYFLAVVEEQSITAASEKLHITQPTLSRQLREMEEDLGKTLFIRGRKKIILTEYGELVYRRAQEMIAISNQMLEELKTGDYNLSGNITIGTPDNKSIMYLLEVIKEMNLQNPDLRFNFISGNEQELKALMENNELDFMISIGNINYQEYHYTKLPYVDVLGVLMRKDDILSGFSQITFDQLINESLLIPNEVQLINALSNFIDFQASNIFGHFSSFQIASLMVKKEFGYAIINKGSVMSEDKDLCFRVLEPHIYIESKLIWRKTKNLDKKLDYFITQLNKHIFELTSESKMKD